MIKLYKLNQKGDDSSSETFRLLIAFVLAAAMLLIIMNMIETSNKQTILVSKQKLKEEIQSAAKSTKTSTKIPFIIEDLILTGNITKTEISSYSGLDEECIGFISGPGIEVLSNGTLKIKKRHLKMNVWAYCDFWKGSINSDEINRAINLNVSRDDCPTFCVFYFNKKPDPEIYK